MTLEGSTVQVHSFVKIRNRQDRTHDCPSHSVFCESPPLPAGEYSFVFGSHEREFTVPSDDPAICAVVDP